LILYSKKKIYVAHSLAQRMQYIRYKKGVRKMEMMKNAIYRIETLQHKIDGSLLDSSIIRDQLSELNEIVGDIAEELRKVIEAKSGR